MAHNETLEDIKELAIDILKGSLHMINKQKPALNHSRQFGFNNVVTDVALEIHQPRIGKVADFTYSTLVMNDGYDIIVYCRAGLSEYGFGVRNEDEFLEITLFDLVEWVLPQDVSDHYQQPRLDLLRDLVEEAKKLTH